MPPSRRPRSTPPTGPFGPGPQADSSSPGTGRRPSWERTQLEARARTTRWIAVGALVIALVAVGLAAWQALGRGGSSTCQTEAWDTAPNAGDLPTGWTISASQYGVDLKYMRFLGPLPSDTTTSQASTDATITCYPEGAADSVRRTMAAITAAGESVANRSDLGDQAFSATDGAGNTLLQVRYGNLVVYLVSSGATPAEVNAIASAFDVAMGGDGGNQPVGTLDAGVSPEASVSAEPSDLAFSSDTPADPTLEAALPTTVGSLQLTVGSETGDQILGDDQFSRAIVAALRDQGRTAGDLHLAYAYDPDSTLDLNVFTIKGLGVKAVRQFVIKTWLAASGAGITQSTITLAGTQVIKIDYGDGGGPSYVLTRSGRVYVIITDDANLAAQAIAALP